jgi:hypothetical protein
MRPHLPLFFIGSRALAYTPLSDRSLLHHLPSSVSISSPDPDFDPKHGTLLSPILVPRVPGTPGHASVQHHFISFVRNNLHPSWTLEWHNFTSTTPATGDRQVPFANLILRRDPPWLAAAESGEGKGPAGRGGGGNVARLTLAAHYDSLYRPEGFVGAVDSAVPCAVLMAVLKGVDAGLTRRWEANGEGDGMEEEKGVQVLFLDGEEAWVEWSETDSLYGAR